MTKVCIVGGSTFIGTAIANRLKSCGLSLILVDNRDRQNHCEHVFTADVIRMDRLPQALR